MTFCFWYLIHWQWRQDSSAIGRAVDKALDALINAIQHGFMLLACLVSLVVLVPLDASWRVLPKHLGGFIRALSFLAGFALLALLRFFMLLFISWWVTPLLVLMVRCYHHWHFQSFRRIIRKNPKGWVESLSHYRQIFPEDRHYKLLLRTACQALARQPVKEVAYG